MANWLTDMKRQRFVNALKSPATQWQAMASNAPIGAVGAPSGLLAPPQPKPANYLGGLLGAASMVPGIGDAAGIAADARMYLTDPKSRTKGNYAMSALGMLPFMPALATVFHGSPHKFDAFDMSKIGTGEGAQAYGHGLYFADNPQTAGYYKDALSGGLPAKVSGGGDSVEVPQWLASRIDSDGIDSAIKEWTGRVAEQRQKMATSQQPWNHEANALRMEEELAAMQRIKAAGNADVAKPGSLYTVDLPDEAIAKMLDWDKPLSEQSAETISALHSAGLVDFSNNIGPKSSGEIGGLGWTKSVRSMSGEEFYRKLTEGKFSNEMFAKGVPKGAAQAEASNALAKHGIPGIRYLDGGSRSGGKGTSNYVVFDDKLPKILKRE